MRELKKQFHIGWDVVLFDLGMVAAFFLVGEIIVGVSVYVFGEVESVFLGGTLLALIMVPFVQILVGTSMMALHFNIAVSMGTTRRRVVPAFMVFVFLGELLAVGVAYLLYHLEKWIFSIAYTGMDVELDFGFVFRWNYILLACFAIVALNMLMGALFLKYGKKALTVFWIIWMVACIGMPRLAHMLKSTQDNAFLRVCRKVLDVLYGFTENGILTGVFLCSAVFILLAWLMLRKQQVEA